MDKRKALIKAQKFSSLVLNEFKPVSIFLFGSYAKGTASSNSDIDIAVVFEEFDENWLHNEQRLWRIAWMVSDDIEPVALELKNDKSGFLEHIKSYALPIYNSKI